MLAVQSRKLHNWKVLGVKVNWWVCSEVRDLNHELPTGAAGSGWAESCRTEEPSWEVGGFDRESWAFPLSPDPGDPSPPDSRCPGQGCVLSEAQVAPEAGADHQPHVQQRLRVVELVGGGFSVLSQAVHSPHQGVWLAPA